MRKPEAFIMDLDKGKCLFMGSFNEAQRKFAQDHAGSSEWIALLDARRGYARCNHRVTAKQPAQKRAKSKSASAEAV